MSERGIRWWFAVHFGILPHIMKEISSAEALRELLKWSKDSRLGCIYTAAGTDAIFSVIQGKLEIRESNIFLEAETGKALMHLRDGEEYAVAEPADLPLTLREGFPPLSGKILRARFRNGDMCCFMAERLVKGATLA